MELLRKEAFFLLQAQQRKQKMHNTMRIFLPNVLSYQIPCIQLPEFGSAFLAEFAQNVFGMCLPMD